MKTKTKNLILLLGQFLLLCPSVAWAFRSGYNLEAFDWKSVQVPMHKGVCFYNKASQDVQEFSRFAIDRLVQTAELNKSQCEPMLTDATIVQEQMKSYFDNIYSEKGITREDGDRVINLNCNNAEEVFRLQLYYYRIYANRGRELEDPKANIFYGKCLDEETRQLKPEVQNLDQCLKDVLAEALKDFNKQCQEDHAGIRNVVDNWRKRISIQETAIIKSHQALQRIFEMAKSEKCLGAQDVAKAAIQSSITIGANVVGTAMGGTAGAIGMSIGAEAINFMVDYLFKFADKKNTIEQVVSDKNFENSVCMWISLQERLCQQFSIIPPEPIIKKSCGLRSPDIVLPPSIGLIDEYNLLTAFPGLGEDENGPTAEPGYQVALNDLIQSAFHRPIDFPEKNKGKKKTFMDMIKDAEPFFKQNNKEDFNRLLKGKEILIYGQQLLKDFEVINSDSPKDSGGKSVVISKLKALDENIKTDRQAKMSLLKEMGKTMQEVEKLNVAKLLENYITFVVKKQEGLDELMAEEMAVEIYKSFKGKMESYLDNIDSLQDINNAAIDIFKPVFKKKLWYRFETSMRNAKQAEKAHLKIKDLIPEERRRRRLATFAQVRDTLKDCLSTQAAFFSHRKAQSVLASYFRPPPMAANLDIERGPDRYLKACAPFMCTGGIPIPHLPSKAEAPIHFQQYSCNVLNDAEEIIRKLRTVYVDTGKICGRTIHQMTDGIASFTQFNPRYRTIKGLKNLIKTQPKREEVKGQLQFQRQPVVDKEKE